MFIPSCSVSWGSTPRSGNSNNRGLKAVVAHGEIRGGVFQGLPGCCRGAAWTGQLLSLLQRPAHSSGPGLPHPAERPFRPPSMSSPHGPLSAGGRAKAQGSPPAGLVPRTCSRNTKNFHYLKTPRFSSRQWGAPQSTNPGARRRHEMGRKSEGLWQNYSGALPLYTMKGSVFSAKVILNWFITLTTSAALVAFAWLWSSMPYVDAWYRAQAQPSDLESFCLQCYPIQWLILLLAPVVVFYIHSNFTALRCDARKVFVTAFVGLGITSMFCLVASLLRRFLSVPALDWTPAAPSLLTLGFNIVLLGLGVGCAVVKWTGKHARQ